MWTSPPPSRAPIKVGAPLVLHQQSFTFPLRVAYSGRSWGLHTAASRKTGVREVRRHVLRGGGPREGDAEVEELLQIGLGLFGGLALFLYGMNLMSSNLQGGGWRAHARHSGRRDEEPSSAFWPVRWPRRCCKAPALPRSWPSGSWRPASWAAPGHPHHHGSEYRHHHHGADHRLQAVRLRARYRACGLPHHAACQAGADEVRRHRRLRLRAFVPRHRHHGRCHEALAENPVFTGHDCPGDGRAGARRSGGHPS